MSFFDDASLAFLPSGGAGKDTKAYSIKPTDGSGDFTFSRGSNLSATRVGPTGLIEKGRENLLLQSNQFDTTWSSLNSPTLTSGQEDKDGGTNAWKFSATSSGSDRAIYQNTTGLNIVVTSSFYAKKGSVDFIYLASTRASSSQAQWFDLANGTLGTKLGSDIIASNIESVGNGWYRCSVTSAPYTAGYSFIALVDGDNSQTSSNGDFVYIQSAQLEIGLAATEVITTGATTGKAGLLEDEPRFDYSGGATCPSLLLEPSRTNLIPNSEYLIDGLTNVTATYNYGTSPDGLNNSTFILPSAAVAAHRIGYTDLFTYAPSTSYIASAFLKSGGHRYAAINLVLRNSGSFQETANGLIDLQENTIVVNGSNTLWTGIDVFKEEYANGFYRYGITAKTPSSGSDRVDVQFNITDENGNSFAGNGTDGVVFYGLQAESGSYPTSYIPNHSGTGSVTRGADDLSLMGASSLIGQTEGTMFFEGSVEHTPENVSIMNFNKSIQFSVALLKATNDKINAFVYNGGSVVFNIVSAATSGKFKCAVAYKSGDTAFYVNGTQVGVNTTTFTPAAGLDEVYIGTYGSPYFAYDHPVECNQALLFDTRLSNTDLETLTTL